MMQAHLAPATTAEDVERCMNTLLQHNKIRNATHNILAYRIYMGNQDAWLQVNCISDDSQPHQQQLPYLFAVSCLAT